MNKIIKSSIIVMIVLSFIMSITSCANRQEAAYVPPYPDPVPPSEEIQEEIVSAYNSIDDDRFIQAFDHFIYYGEYSGCHILLLPSMIATTLNVVVEDYRFESTYYSTMYVYKDGEFKSLNEAYEGGWLTKDDIASLNEYHRFAGLPIHEREIPVKTSPNLKPGKLDERTKTQFEYLFKDGFTHPEDICHYGNYDGVIVFFYEYGDEKHTEHTMKNGDVIVNERAFNFIIHENERLKTVPAGDLDEYLTDEAISEIVKYHNSRNK